MICCTLSLVLSDKESSLLREPAIAPVNKASSSLHLDEENMLDRELELFQLQYGKAITDDACATLPEFVGFNVQP